MKKSELITENDFLNNIIIELLKFMKNNKKLEVKIENSNRIFIEYGYNEYHSIKENNIYLISDNGKVFNFNFDEIVYNGIKNIKINKGELK